MLTLGMGSKISLVRLSDVWHQFHTIFASSNDMPELLKALTALKAPFHLKELEVQKTNICIETYQALMPFAPVMSDA
jgi:hypothetical protein